MEQQELRLCPIESGDLYWITANAVDDTVIKLINDGNLKMLRAKDVEVKQKKFLFFKVKKKYKTILVQVITPWVKEDTDERDV
jgi:peroxiredoxin